MQEPTGDIPTWLMTIIAAVAYALHRRITRNLEDLAEEFGLTFYERGKGHVAVPTDFVRFWKSAFQISDEVCLVIQGEIDGIEVSIFEYRRYRAGDQGRKRLHGYPVTAALFVVPGLDLPRFTARPEPLHHKIGLGMGGQDIDFPDAPRFSRIYLVTGDDEAAVREMFGPSARGFLESHPGRVLMGLANEVVYFRPPRLRRFLAFRARTVRRLLSEGLELVRLLPTYDWARRSRNMWTSFRF